MKRILICSLLVVLALAATALRAQVTAAPEEVKAAFLYRFAAFVEWPEAAPPGGFFTLGVAGDQRIEQELRRISAGRTVRDRPVRVVQIQGIDDVADLDVLFIGGMFAGPPGPLIGAALARHALVVTDLENGLDHGSIINFETGERVRFEISLESARKAGLRLSPRLLSVSVRVRKGELADQSEYA